MTIVMDYVDRPRICRFMYFTLVPDLNLRKDPDENYLSKLKIEI